MIHLVSHCCEIVHCPGDLDGEIVRCPSFNLEIEMSRTAAQSTPAARRKIASSLLGDSDPICLNGDRPRIAQATRKAHAKHRDSLRPPVDPTTSERDLQDAELEFMHAMQEYKQRSGRMFPTWSEVLEVLQGLGYAKATGDNAMPGVQSATSQEASS